MNTHIYLNIIAYTAPDLLGNLPNLYFFKVGLFLSLNSTNKSSERIGMLISTVRRCLLETMRRGNQNPHHLANTTNANPVLAIVFQGLGLPFKIF